MIMKKDNSEVELTLLVCAYNEEGNIDLFLETAIPVLERHCESYEILFVNDGSRDQTAQKILSFETDARIRLINFSRNFGKEKAITAGLDHARGRAVIPIDADLQEPIEAIPDFMAKWKEGYKNVVGVRKNRLYEGPIKRFVSGIFYRVLEKTSTINIIPNAGDFRLLDRKVVDELVKMRESNRFMKGMYALPGFSKTTVEYEIKTRNSGESKWNFWKLWNFSLDGIFSFSTMPLRAWTYIGAFICLVSFLYALFVIIKTIIYGDVPGYTTIVVLLLFFGGVQLISVGVLGEYIGRIFEQSKNRPLYIIEDIIERNVPNNQ